MALGTKEVLQDSGSAMTAGMSQMQQAGRREAVADGWCPICLDNMDNAAYIDVCFHAFCFDCIRQWAAMRAACPLCRWPFNRILHTVRADNNYQEYMVGSSTCWQRTAARQRVRSRSPQRRYHLRPRPNNNEPAAGRRGPVGRDRAAWGDAAPRTSDASTRQAAGERPASPADGSVLRFDVLALQAQIIGSVDIE
ncbi:E3 ubiquitin-protein ligase Topors-like [Gymnogyps californianus]|uniref:E3 ubiquitin-protein ligase Topors-like n=1 Tax=Gymnogyps californianus TaxID=33616 RepID=UPI0021C63958|nr:E3 ubiquitin-protein ligase Topors-like [Gymnogyps californianus]